MSTFVEEDTINLSKTEQICDANIGSLADNEDRFKQSFSKKIVILVLI